MSDISGDKYAEIANAADNAVTRLRYYANEMRVLAYSRIEENLRLRDALNVAQHGLTTCHGLMAYDDATVIGAKQHFRLDHTEELAAIKEALAVKS